MQDLYKELIQLLEADQALIIDDKLNKGLIIDRALRLEPALIKLLLTNTSIKKQFFVDIEGILVFDKVAFQRFVNAKNFLPDSYTQYKNKIGLSTDNDHYITDSREVVLVWPHKDCVLEGGQTKEDAKRNEIFYNTTLAPDEIDVLTAPKVLTNWKQYDKDGETIPTKISKADNLIIKGNNLLALHTLKEKYKGQVKLIYIDPPYNTGNDTFSYNDSFNHSTWFTFMKNRLEAARDLLRIDGFICCHIDNNEGEYLKVLMDEIFGYENYINTFYIRVRYPDKTLKQDMDFHKEMESIHIYKKSNSSKPILNEIETTIDKYVFYFKEISEGKEIELGGKKVIVFNKDEIKIEQKEASNIGRKEIWATGSILDGNSSGRFFRDYLTGRYEEDGLGVVYKVFGVGDETDGYRYFTGPQKVGATKGKYFQGIPNSQLISDNKIKTVPINNFYDLAGNFGNCRLEGGVELRSGKKPEELLKIIIHHFSKENDIVLDYHLGSGTTCAVAQKMNRRYIGLEQLDYGHNDSVIRLKNVIGGEQSGISKSVNWKGGGSFVYAELMQSNQNYITQIQKAKTTNELLKIWDEMQATAFISYKVLPQNINNEIKEFEALSFEEQQRFLIEILDKNLLYVNKSEMNDARHNVSEADKEMNKNFYTM